jgi:ubiquinone/menaquinone biosynthesis C-methylase UbiE
VAAARPVATGEGIANGARSGTYPVPRCDGERVALHPEQQLERWNDCCDMYDVFAENVPRPFAEDALRLVRMSSATRLLDVATGTGVLARAAARQGARVTATDFAPSMLERLEAKCRQEGLDNVQGRVMDGQDLTLPAGSVDVAASLFGLMFFPSPDRGLRQLLRVLRPGGRALVATWASPARVEMLRIVGEALMACGYEPAPGPAPSWPALGERHALQARLVAAGFARVHVVPVRHVAVFDSAPLVARLMPAAIPSAAAATASMSERQRALFFEAIVDGLWDCQGTEGPFALSNEALIAVATKAS